MKLLLKTAALILIALSAAITTSCGNAQNSQDEQITISGDQVYKYLDDIAAQKNASLEQAQKKDSRPYQYKD